MTMKELMRKTDDELETLYTALVFRGSMTAASLVHDVMEYGHKRVKVVKGRKVPHGTTGECFWMGSYDHSKYGDPWGIYTTVRIGIKDDSGNVYWTALDNVELAE